MPLALALAPSPSSPPHHLRTPSPRRWLAGRRARHLAHVALCAAVLAALFVYCRYDWIRTLAAPATTPDAFSGDWTRLAPLDPALVGDDVLEQAQAGRVDQKDERASPGDTHDDDELPLFPLDSHTTLLPALPRTRAVSYENPWYLSGPRKKLPPCERILLFQFMPWWGFASEYILYARAAAAAKKLGYTFLEDDRNWNYGRLRNYFQPRKLTCAPPSNWWDPRLAEPLSPSSARTRPARLVYSRLHLSNLDDWTRETYLSSRAAVDALEALRRADEEHAVEADRWILEEGGTLPAVLEEVFQDQSRAVNRLWRLNRELKAHVDEVKRGSGLEREKWLVDERLRGEAGMDAADKPRRGPMIAMHVRLGDKAAEYEHDSQLMGITNTFGNMTVFVEAAHDAYRRLLPSRYPSLSDSLPRFSPYARPSLLLITAEPSIPAALRASTPLSRPFELVQTPDPDLRTEEEGAGAVGGRERLRVQLNAAGEGAKGPKAYAREAEGRMVKRPRLLRRAVEADEAASESAPAEPPSPPDLRKGYTQAAFNALPLLERIVHTQAFVRDVTLLAREVDAAVVSGASNVGRLAMLIAGKEAVTGPKDEFGVALGGRIRSVDAHFYPTAYATAIYSQVADVEDLDNAAFLPDEQHAAEQKAVAAAAARKKQRQERRKAAKDKARRRTAQGDDRGGAG
ncbi:uncharacterized protein JCM10292_004290 [Rhodotorula paludigena]|uniref:uncharacterized protein n=1 Tax=Rhodotorula paludigena TaxID=86838 RepID=UPI003171688F